MRNGYSVTWSVCFIRDCCCFHDIVIRLYYSIVFFVYLCDIVMRLYYSVLLLFLFDMVNEFFYSMLVLVSLPIIVITHYDYCFLFGSVNDTTLLLSLLSTYLEFCLIGDALTCYYLFLKFFCCRVI